MKIEKFIKKNQNSYKVIIDNEEYSFYEDIILEYNLLSKKEIDDKFLKEVCDANESLESYYLAIKYINKKVRSKLEIKNYLNGKFDYKTIDKTIKKLEDNKFLDDERFLKCFIADKINLSDAGINKIKAELIKYGIDVEIIDDALSKIDREVWENKIDNFIQKKIKLNRKDGPSLLKYKIRNDLLNKGYTLDQIESLIESYDYYDENVYKKEYNKIKDKLEKKYEGRELELHIKKKMYEKGFRIYD